MYIIAFTKLRCYVLNWDVGKQLLCSLTTIFNCMLAMLMFDTHTCMFSLVYNTPTRQRGCELPPDAWDMHICNYGLLCRVNSLFISILHSGLNCAVLLFSHKYFVAVVCMHVIEVLVCLNIFSQVSKGGLFHCYWLALPILCRRLNPTKNVLLFKPTCYLYIHSLNLRQRAIS